MKNLFTQQLFILLFLIGSLSAVYASGQANGGERYKGVTVSKTFNTPETTQKESARDEACLPPQNVIASLYGDAFPYNHVKVTWDAPADPPVAPTGYNVYKNDALVATNISQAEYNDNASLTAGKYTYCVEAVYSNDCGKSKKVCATTYVTKVCSDAKAPAFLTVEQHAKEWYDIDLAWINPNGSNLNYSYGTSLGALGSDGIPLSLAIHFMPEDLTRFENGEITKVSFAPMEGSTEKITIMIYEGGEEEPGTLMLTEEANVGMLTFGSWNELTLKKAHTLDTSKDLWIVVKYEEYLGFPAGMSEGNTKPYYSDLFKAETDDMWMSIQSDLQEAGDCCISAYVKTSDAEEAVIGYHVYRNNELLTKEEMVPSGEEYFHDQVSEAGVYSYEVSTIYDNYCESQAREKATVNMSAYPCEHNWTLPFSEGFEDTRFPAWCWDIYSETESNWTRESAGIYPTCQPHSGSGLGYFFSFNYKNDMTGLLISPPFSHDKNARLSFWMYRSGNSPSAADRINVYLSSTPDISGLEPLLTINRPIALSPIEQEDGWHNYTVDLNTAQMETSYVIFEGVSDWGMNMFLDDIDVFDPSQCDPIQNIAVEQPKESEVRLSWAAPLNDGLSGFKVMRGSEVLANNHQDNFFTDTAPIGTYDYYITALFNKTACTQSTEAHSSVEVVPQCDPVASLTAEITGIRTVTLTWPAPTAINVKSYTIYCDGVIIKENASGTSYVHSNADPGEHEYSMTVNYTGKPCDISDPVFSAPIRVEYCSPVEDVMGSATEEAATLTWKFDGKGFKEILLTESFDTEIPSTWLNLDKDEDYFKWYFAWTGGGQGNNQGFAYSESFAWDPLTPDNWLISPPITLAGSEKILEYYVSTVYEAPAEHYGVFISTAGTDYDDFTLLFEETLTIEEADWSLRQIDLSNYSGTVYIAFRHYDVTDQWSVSIDNVTVFGTWGIPTFDIYKDDVFLTTATSATFKDTEVENGATYKYCIEAKYNNCTVDPVCSEVTIPLCEPASNVSAEANKEAGKVILTWNYSTPDVSFEIYRNDNYITTVEQATYEDVVVSNSLYEYCILPLDPECPNLEQACTSINVDWVAISDIHPGMVKVYPNPTTGALRITNEEQDIRNIQVFDVAGRLLLEYENIDNKEVNINLIEWENGVYFIKVDERIVKIIKH